MSGYLSQNFTFSKAVLHIKLSQISQIGTGKNSEIGTGKTQENIVLCGSEPLWFVVFPTNDPDMSPDRDIPITRFDDQLPRLTKCTGH